MSDRTEWDSSWKLSVDLLGLETSLRFRVASWTLCVAARNAGILTSESDGIRGVRGWRLAVGVTREHAAAVLKALVLAFEGGS